MPWLALVQTAGVMGILVAAYFRATDTVALTLVALVVAAVLVSKTPRRMRALDWAVLLAGAYEIASLAFTSYAANSIWYAEIVILAVVLYLLVRMAIESAWQSLVIAGAIGLCGAYLAWRAMVQFASNVAALGEVGLTGYVAFRSRLITPPGYILGEWLTILLLTLSFACALPLWLWMRGRSRLALAALIAPVTIAAMLCLSCSRAVFWSVVIFVVCACGLAAGYRMVRMRTALLLAAAALAALGLALAAENAAYPGLAQSYTGSHSSQVRSTEGRLAIWKRSADLFREHPVWGVGAGNSPLYLNSTADQDETTGFASRTFSLPLQLLAEKGIVGVLVYGAVFLLVAWEAHRRMRAPGVVAAARVIPCCLFAGLLAVIARELTYSSLLEHMVTVLLVATGIGLIGGGEDTCKSAG